MTENNDPESRRRYWAEQLELGYQLVQQIETFPVQECCEEFASLKDAAAAGGVEMLFSESKIAGEFDRIFFLRESLVKDIIAIARDMNHRGWILKIEDGYRSLAMQRQLGAKPEIFDAILQKCIWENGGTIPPVEMIFRRGSVLVANLPKVGTHMSGTAVDISVFRRDDGTEVWRGNKYLEMSERTPMRSPFIEPDALQNRLEITAMMEARGFMHFPFEFWHFNKHDALGNILTQNTAPAKFGPVHWDASTNQVIPVENPSKPLRPLPEIEQEILAAVERARHIN